MKALVLAVLVLSACAPSKPATPPVAAAKQPFALPFIDDDYPRALARARADNRLLFVDVWAPWCHTCLSLRAYVLRDPALARLSNKFVWAAIDTEKEGNAAFVAAHPIESWPTLFVIDPKTDAVVLKWAGGATVAELESLLDRALAGHTEKSVEDRVSELAKKGDRAGCAALAKEELPRMAHGTSRANVALAGLDCARGTPDAAHFVDAITTMVVDPKEPILADDRSALYEVLIEERKALGDKAGAKSLARAWATFLEGEAARAPDAAGRTVFDSHRMGAYLELGEPARAVPMLEESERDFPNDYNPPARLAKIHLVMGHHAPARAAITRALAKAYGPRRMRLLALSADIAHATGDAKTERQALDDAIAIGKSTSLSAGYKKLLEQLEIRRAALDAP